MTEPHAPPPARRPWSRIILHETLGAAVALAGSLILLGLVYVSNDPAPFAEHLLFRLGLALTSLISAVAQVLVVVGVAILWSAARRRPP